MMIGPNAVAIIERFVNHAGVVILLGDSYCFTDRDLGRVSAATNKAELAVQSGHFSAVVRAPALRLPLTRAEMDEMLGKDVDGLEPRGGSRRSSRQPATAS